jgi:hypothetical protein
MMTSARFSRLAGALLGAVLAVAVPTAQPAAAQDSIVIRDFVLTHGIYEREPVGRTEAFASGDGRGYVFARIANDGAPTRISFLWYRGEDLHAAIDATIGTSAAWRTWSSVNLQPGQWRVKLRDAGGRVIAERAFTVAAEGTASADARTDEPTATVSARGGGGGAASEGWHGPHDGG